MAGNKVNSKTKGKEDKNKTNKNTCQNSEDTEDLDYTLLRKPIPTSVTGFAQARKVFDLATAELKELLSNECDLLYECKVCRNLFRSLANFISHKRVYCKEKFNCTVHSHFININSVHNELQKIKKFEENYQEFLKENGKINIDNNEENDVRIPLTKDLTSIIEKIVSSKGVQGDHLKQQDVVLQTIPKTSVAVYQSIKYDGNDDNMSTQVKELDTILSRENAVMQNDGRFQTENSSHVETENVIQISDDEESDCMGNLKCKLCDQQFSTQKTLKSHIKTKHLESRLVYPCPDCLEIFSTSWSVYRHLFKVHRKTAAQIRRLRETIQSKAFRMNNPPASYERRKANAKNVTPPKITEEERIDQENQAWMDNMEGDGELPRCGGCGRTFERRAALAAHTNTCQPRSRALARRPPETKKIEIQIRKDYNKGPAASAAAKPQDKNEDAPSPSKPHAQKDDSESRSDSTLTEAVMSIVGVTGAEEANEIIEEPVEEPKLDMEAIKPLQKLPYSHQAEKSNFNALKQRILKDIELGQLSCKKCDNKYTQINELYDHVASHYKWMRYACKLCNFKHYEYEKVPEHVKIVHKLKGDSEFYFSTVKAIDGVEASELSDHKEEGNEPNETSPNSRRPSRCSSDSSRFSDDSCSSTSTRIEVGSRKRKMNPYRNASKKKKEVFIDEGDGDSKDGEVSPQKDPLLIENDSSSSSKVFEENSSDMDESEDKSVKRVRIDYLSSVASRRPVRKRTKPKNEDFEYDLSNLLKMEAQGYRDSQVNTIKPTVTKKKTLQDYQTNYNNINKECCGALTSLSRQSVEGNKAHMKTNNLTIFNTTKEQRISNIFVRPMLPKISRVDKISPVKEPSSETEKEITITNPNSLESNEAAVVTKNISNEQTQPKQNELKVIPVQEINDKAMTSEIVLKETTNEAVKKEDSKPMSDLKDGPSDTQTPESTPQEKTKSNLNIVPIKLNKQGLDLIKNPLIKKNMTDFSKAGMKTKILVIKPINRKDRVQSINTPLKFQTIKLKDPNVNKKNEEKPSDQVVVVKVPKVDCVLPRPPAISNNNTFSDPATRTPVESKEVDNCDIKCKESKEENQSETNSEDANVETCNNKNLLPVTDTNEVAVTR